MESRISRCKIVDRPGKPPLVWFELPGRELLDRFRGLEGKSLEGHVMTVKKPRAKSLNANAYMWQLCDKIARKTGVTKDDVYCEAIRHVGAFHDGDFQREDTDAICRLWGRNGIGWFAEALSESNRFAAIRFYQGSSVYDGEQMGRLVDYIVGEAQCLGIETMPPHETERLKQLWDGKDT